MSYWRWRRHGLCVQLFFIEQSVLRVVRGTLILFTRTNTQTHTQTHTCIYIYICVCVCVCVYIYTHTHIYIYIYIYIRVCLWNMFICFLSYTFDIPYIVTLLSVLFLLFKILTFLTVYLVYLWLNYFLIIKETENELKRSHLQRSTS